MTSAPDRHLAHYVLERGTWRATCRLCGYSVKDPSRRRAAAIFRNHIRETLGILVNVPALEAIGPGDRAGAHDAEGSSHSGPPVP